MLSYVLVAGTTLVHLLVLCTKFFVNVWKCTVLLVWLLCICVSPCLYFFLIYKCNPCVCIIQPKFVLFFTRGLSFLLDFVGWGVLTFQIDVVDSSCNRRPLPCVPLILTLMSEPTPPFLYFH